MSAQAADVRRQVEEAYRSGYPRFERVARAFSGDRERGREAVQDGFVDALRSAARYEGRGSIDAWVWACVVNRARKARERATRPLEDVAERGGEPNHDGGPAAIRARIALLPERQRLAVFLRYYADLEYRDIADVLGIAVGTVSATLAAAHATLRISLQEADR